jgi:hypothetical protein
MCAAFLRARPHRFGRRRSPLSASRPPFFGASANATGATDGRTPLALGEDSQDCRCGDGRERGAGGGPRCRRWRHGPDGTRHRDRGAERGTAAPYRVEEPEKAAPQSLDDELGAALAAEPRKPTTRPAARTTRRRTGVAHRAPRAAAPPASAEQAAPAVISTPSEGTTVAPNATASAASNRAAQPASPACSNCRETR